MPVRRVIAAVSTSLLLGAACTDGPSGAATPEEVAARYGLTLSVPGAPLPLFEVLPSLHHPDEGRADQLLVHACMVGRGHAGWPRPVTRTKTTMEARTYERIVDPDLAAEVGYSLHPSEYQEEVQASRASEAALAGLGAQGQADLTACRDEASSRLAIPDDLGPASRLFSEAHSGARAEVADGPAAAAWRRCMAPLGVGDLPTNPFEMPPASVVPPPSSDLVDQPPRAPDRRELEVAVRDAECRERSGFDDALRAAEERLQLEGMASDLEGFDAMRVESAAAADRIERVVAEHGG